MRQMHEDHVQHAPWCDVELEALSWTNQGRDMTFAVHFADGAAVPSPRMTLHCRWASGLRMDVTRREDAGGRLLTWNATFERTDVGWAVSFDFAGDGDISLACSAIELLPTS
jgi:hypothetical protein